MNNAFPDDSALSPVIGEMMMIVVALLLVSLFSVTLLGLLPSERSDMIDISIEKDVDYPESITLWHKGGDWVKNSDLKIVIIKENPKETFNIGPSSDAFIQNFRKSNSFDLGDSITVQPGLDAGIGFDDFEKGDIVRLVNDKSVIFSGVI